MSIIGRSFMLITTGSQRVKSLLASVVSPLMGVVFFFSDIVDCVMFVSFVCCCFCSFVLFRPWKRKRQRSLVSSLSIWQNPLLLAQLKYGFYWSHAQTLF